MEELFYSSRVSPTYLGARAEKSDVSSQGRFAENARRAASPRKLYTAIATSERHVSRPSFGIENGERV